MFWEFEIEQWLGNISGILRPFASFEGHLEAFTLDNVLGSPSDFRRIFVGIQIPFWGRG